tara:strand:+ start:280 stop:456 length:177 start_codon:yes stop_codon:yes gene_type:complete
LAATTGDDFFIKLALGFLTGFSKGDFLPQALNKTSKLIRIKVLKQDIVKGFLFCKKTV